MNQQQQYRRSKWLHPSLGILNLPIAAIAISIGLLRYVYRGLVAVNGAVYRFASRVEQWAVK
jgi:hypothetical protein